MKRIILTLSAAALLLSFVACGDKETDEPDTTSGATSETLKAGTIGNGTITIAGYTENAYGVDFDKDGVLEFKISGEYIAYNWTEGGNNIVNKANQWDYIEPIGTSIVIDANSRFEGQGDAMFEDITSLPELFFIGCRFMLSDGIHYGWIKMKKVNGELEWGEAVYRTTPGVSITTGAN